MEDVINNIEHPILLPPYPNDGDTVHCMMNKESLIAVRGEWFAIGQNTLSANYVSDYVKLNTIIHKTYPDNYSYHNLEIFKIFINELESGDMIALINQSPVMFEFIEYPTKEMERLHALKWKI